MKFEEGRKKRNENSESTFVLLSNKNLQSAWLEVKKKRKILSFLSLFSLWLTLPNPRLLKFPYNRIGRQ